MWFIWRFQCDWDGSTLDPDIEAFLGLTGTINNMTVTQKFNTPVIVKFSLLNQLVTNAALPDGTSLSDAIAALAPKDLT